MSKEKFQFKVSSALKNIIGKDLIVDDFVAIFELVKNSFDANSKKVDVTFNDILTKSGTIIIQDDGKGMDLEDIKSKWLFVAYSAKKEGTEDYRDEIKSNRIHAGAKGIGRFSCDRLGRNLVIYTRRNKYELISKLTIDWNEFEEDMHINFDKINLSYEETQSCPYSFDNGTILEISHLRSDWNQDKLINLKRSLEKLINPSQNNDTESFSIYLHAKDFLSQDKKNGATKENIINGKIENFLFEKLNLKTTYIEVEIDSTGESITTVLFDRGHFVYRILEENPYKIDADYLSDIKVSLFSLNQATKSLFTKHMGIRPVQFGSVFVYKNGFRIHPIGEIGHGDVFALDGRKQQGTSRYFGTRDLVGRVEINGINENLREASSRDGGLERNKHFDLLKDFFIERVLRRLERFAVGVVKYGNIEDFDTTDLSSNFPTDKALDFIEKLTKSGSIHDIEYNPDIFDVIADSSEKSLRSLLKNLSRIAADSNRPELDSEVKRIEKKLNELSKVVNDAEKEAQSEKQQRIIAEAKAEKTTKENKIVKNKLKAETERSNFLEHLLDPEKTLDALITHVIQQISGGIEKDARSILTEYYNSPESVSKEDLIEVLEYAVMDISTIKETANMATKANFNLKISSINQDLFKFIDEYIDKIVSKDRKWGVKIITNNISGSSHKISFKPADICVLFINILENARKANAKNLFIEFTNKQISFIDDGDGFDFEALEAKDYFKKGITTRHEGSGLGLYHCNEIAKGINAKLSIENNDNKGALIKLEF